MSLHEVDTDSFECRNCGYIHVKEDGRKPSQCVSCGARDFRQVSDEKQNRVSNSESVISEHLNQISGKQILIYIILAFILLGSLFGLLVLSLM